jgi:hypothetical protein
MWKEERAWLRWRTVGDMTAWIDIGLLHASEVLLERQQCPNNKECRASLVERDNA